MDRLLIITASPRGRRPLCLDEEVRAIRERLRASPRSNDLELHYYGAARYPDIEQAVRMLSPRFVHFAGYHSQEQGGPLLEDDERGPCDVSAEVFAELFKPRDGWVECLYFSTCYVGRYAEVLAKHVRHVVGMTQQVDDQVCVQFAAAFYGAVFENSGISDAFDSARRVLSVAKLGSGAPVLFSNPHYLNVAPAVETARSEAGVGTENRTRVLVLSANPADAHQLEIDVEVRSIRAGLHAAGQGQKFYILHCPAVRPADITREIQAFRPEIVHFAGHGLRGKTGLGIAVQDQLGGQQFLNSAILTKFFKFLSGHVRCVIWNSCNSAQLASQTSTHGPYTIGYETSISDQAAIQFAVEFYAAYGGGASLEASFELARAQLEAMDMKEAAIVRLFTSTPPAPEPEFLNIVPTKPTSAMSTLLREDVAVAAGLRGLQATKQGNEARTDALPNRRALRLALERMIATDADLDAFLIDYFPEIKRLLSGEMDRSG